MGISLYQSVTGSFVHAAPTESSTSRSCPRAGRRAEVLLSAPAARLLILVSTVAVATLLNGCVSVAKTASTPRSRDHARQSPTLALRSLPLQLLPTPEASYSATGELLSQPGVISVTQGEAVITTKCGKAVKTVEPDAYRIRYHVPDPARSSLVLATTKTAEAFVAYPGSSQATEARNVDAYVTFTLHPTRDPACGLARGKLEWLVSGLDWNHPNESRNVEVHCLNFNPCATVLLGDPDYEYPLLPGFRVKGEGIRFVRQPPSIVLELRKRQREANTSNATRSRPSRASSWHTVSNVPGIELLGDTELVRAE